MEVDQIFVLFEVSDVMYYAGLAGLFMLGITVLEMVFDWRAKRQRDWRDSGVNILIGLFKELGVGTAAAIVGVVGLYFVSLLQPWELEMTVWSWVAGVVFADFIYYWMHRFEHENRLLWAHHSVHHSSQSFNLTTALRLSVIEDFIEWIFLAPMVLIGFNVFQSFACLIIVAVYQHWIHTEKIGRLGVLDSWFNTPSTHRVHHGANAQYLDKNYGGILMLWDHLFGTFERERETVEYGLVKNIDTYNPVTINFIAYIQIWQDMKQCRSAGDKLRILLGATNWRPDYFSQQKKRAR